MYLQTMSRYFYLSIYGSTAIWPLLDLAAGCEAHMNFADESACLKADNVWNERN
jgi:hypothetical protein